MNNETETVVGTFGYALCTIAAGRASDVLIRKLAFTNQQIVPINVEAFPNTIFGTVKDKEWAAYKAKNEPPVSYSKIAVPDTSKVNTLAYDKVKKVEISNASGDDATIKFDIGFFSMNMAQTTYTIPKASVQAITELIKKTPLGPKLVVRQ